MLVMNELKYSAVLDCPPSPRWNFYHATEQWFDWL